MTRVLYFSQGLSVHDVRFLKRIAGWSYETVFLPHDAIPAGEAAPVGVKTVTWSRPEAWDDRVAEFRRLVDLEQPDVIHAGPLNTCAAIATDAGVHPLVSMSWGSDLLRLAEWNADDQGRVRRALAGADGCVGDCRTIRQAMVDAARVDPRRVGIFPWGIDLAQFTPESPRRNWRTDWNASGRRVVLHTRSITKRYGADVLVRAVAEARQPDLLLVLVGDGADRAAILAEASARGVSGQVLHQPPVPYAALPDLFRSADLYVSCSPTDGTSISMLEALATGVPIAVPDIPSNREWIEPNRHGWLFPVGDAGALAGILRQARRTESMARANRARAEARADWMRNSEVLRGVYEGVRGGTAWPPPTPLECGMEGGGA